MPLSDAGTPMTGPARPGDPRGGIAEGHTADIVVGIPTYNCGQTIDRTVEAVRAGLTRCFSGRSAAVVVADGGSTDDTLARAQLRESAGPAAVIVRPLERPVSAGCMPYHGVPGRAAAIKAVLETARLLDAQVCVLAGTDTTDTLGERIEPLAGPVLSGDFDYAAPLYQRHKYEGTIANLILYPLMRMLYGKPLRQPLTGEAALSAGLTASLLEDPLWKSDKLCGGVDLWVATAALKGDFKICQTNVGEKKGRDQGQAAVDLSETLYQVLGAAFDFMETYRSVWRGVKATSDVSCLGGIPPVRLEAATVNLDAMITRFRISVKELMKVWSAVLPGDAMNFLHKAALLPKNRFYFPDDVWAEIVCSFALAHHRKIMHPAHLLKSFTPLYVGKTASFVISTMTGDEAAFEERVEGICKAFEARRYFLRVNWPT